MKHGKGSEKTTAAKKSQSKSRPQAKKSGKPPSKITATKGRAPAARPVAGRSGPQHAGGKGDVRSGPVSFSNVLVANAFRRAVKKYATALKRLTD
jgi:hypothetical protein